MPVNGNDDTDIDKPLHRHHRLVDNAGSEPWQSAGDVGDNDVTVGAVSSSDITLTHVNSVASAETGSNGASTLSSGDTNGASTMSAGDSVSSDGSFNGFIVAMHRKMVSDHVLTKCHFYVCFNFYFRISAPKVWNTLPLHIRQSQSLSTFRWHLKTHYFQLAYPAT